MFTADVDLKTFMKGMDALQREQIPFAAKNALNAVGLEVQAAARARMHQLFTVRRPDWVDRSVKITHFAKKTELWTTIAIAPPGGPSRADVLGKFETDTTKRPQSGRSIAVPVEAKRNKHDIITRANRPRQLLEKKGTFLVRLSDGKGLILKRQKASVRLGRVARNQVLFVLVPEVHIRPDLRFAPTAAEVITRRWPVRMGEALASALASAR